MVGGKVNIANLKNFSRTSIKLSSIEPGSDCRVVAVTGNGHVSRRLQEMGVIPGVRVRMVKSAPFGDPFEVRLLGYSLALRKSEAELVEVVA
jgi:Fe2+ transport system protein FeoA